MIQDEQRKGGQGALGRGMLFAVLWFVSTFYFCGELGKWNDDWGFHSRDPVTGAADWGRVFSLNPMGTYFWRPLHIHGGMVVQTVLWNHYWAAHLLLALVHGLNAILLWRVLGKMCASRQAPALGALLFLVYPAGHEAVFWMSTVGTPMSVCWFLLCARAVQRFAAGEIGRWGLLLHVPLLMTIAWWYEQGAAIAPAIAIVYLASVRPMRLARTHVMIAMGIFAATIGAGMVSAGLLVGTMSGAARGGANSIIKPSELGGQLELILQQAWTYVSLRDFVPGALREGWQGLLSRPVEAILVGAALLVACIVFARWWMRVCDASQANDDGRPAPVQRLLVVGAGLMIAAASMVPALAIHGQWFASRLAYMPVLGLVMALTGILDIPLGALWAQTRANGALVWRAAVLAACVAAVVCGAVMMVGVQSVWHHRAAMDRRVEEELRTLVPDPAANAMFVPVAIAELPTSTGSKMFDLVGMGPFEMAWSSPLFVRFALHRNDLNGLVFGRWLAQGKRIAGCAGASEDGLHLDRGMYNAGSVYPLDEVGRAVVPWSKVVAFRIVKGQVRLVDSVRIEQPTVPDGDRVIRLREGSGAPLVIDAVEFPGRKPLQFAWELMGEDGAAAESQRAAAPTMALGHQYDAFTMHPPADQLRNRCVLRASIEPSARERTVAMRVAMLDHVLTESDGVEVAMYLDGVAEPIARELITPERLKQERKWIVVRGEVKPLGVSQRIRVVVSAGPAGNPNSDWCLVTVPVVVEK